jgi:FKBP-type peptidyl-prolyl cis-trans isomerase
MKMKKFIYLTLSIFIAFSFASCNSDAIDEAWKDINQDAYNKITNDSEYKDVRLTFHPTDGTGPQGVYFKELKRGTGAEYPLQTSKVKVLYYGYFYDETKFDAGTSGNNIPVEFSTASTIRGFSYALQNMVVGDHWKICIPYYLGYGTTGDSYGTIKPYTTLFFDVELVSITQYP